jgi:hypothetical protein
MNEDLNKILGIGETPPSSQSTVAGPKRPLWLFLGAVLCLGGALCFLLKPERGSWSATFMGSDNQVHTVSTGGVSAFAYYGIWSAAKRQALEEQEQAALSMKIRGAMFKPEDVLNTVPERVAKNARVAAFFGLVAVVLCFVGVIVSARPARLTPPPRPPVSAEF